MFTPGGQLDHLTFAAMRGGGKGGGGGSDPRFQETTLVDPVSGRAFTSSPSSVYFGGKSASDQLNEEITARQAQEKQDSDTAAAKATTDAATKETTFQGNRQTAYNDALAATIHSFQQQGLDPNQYMESDIKPALQRQFNSIQDLDPNPAASFPTTLGDTILNSVTSGKRTQALNTLNSTFTPTYANNLIPDTTTSNYIDQILGEQFDPLGQELINAQKRNTLTPVGYNAALDALNQKKTAARSTIQTLGQGIVDKDRSSLNDLISGARTDANALTPGANFDPSAYIGQVGSRAQSELGSFGGDLRNAIGDTKFADIQDLINAGGAVQGANNPTAANPAGGTVGTSPNFVADDVLAQQKRGLGNVGAF